MTYSSYNRCIIHFGMAVVGLWDHNGIRKFKRPRHYADSLSPPGPALCFSTYVKGSTQIPNTLEPNKSSFQNGHLTGLRASKGRTLSWPIGNSTAHIQSLYTYMYLCMPILYIYTYTYENMCAYIHIYMCKYIYPYIYIYIYICT